MHILVVGAMVAVAAMCLGVVYMIGRDDGIEYVEDNDF